MFRLSTTLLSVRALTLGATGVVTLLLLRAETPEPITPWASHAGIQGHLQRVEGGLRVAEVSGLDPARQLRRARNLDRLQEYWRAGVFPHNEGISSEPVPIFIDAHGHPCAVGYLMIESGAEALALRIAADENYDYVADIGTPGVGEWARENGLTIQELAHIQPSYPGDPDCTNLECHCDTDYVTTHALPELPDPSSYAYEGPCRCEGCPDDTQWQLGDDWSYGEVCGEDQVTYENECHALLCGQTEVDRLGPCSAAGSEATGEGCSCATNETPTLWGLLCLLGVRRRRR